MVGCVVCAVMRSEADGEEEEGEGGGCRDSRKVRRSVSGGLLSARGCGLEGSCGAEGEGA